MHIARRDRSGRGRLATPPKPTRSRGSVWFIGLTILTLGLAAAVAAPLFICGTRQGLIQRNSWSPSADPITTPTGS
jgi:hypothetical protein